MRNTRLILALDVDGATEVKRIVSSLEGSVDFFKVGLRLFVNEGPDIVRFLNKHGSVFLDLKFHDIPNTVFTAVQEAVKLGVELVDVHASGGAEMMRAAADAAKGSTTRVIGVTVLTSLNAQHLEKELGIGGSVESAVARLAGLAKESGLDGIVASARELPVLRKNLGEEPIIVTPGIRLPGGETHDQKRVVTPEDAARNGADYIVMGRPVLQSKDMAGTVGKIRALLKEAQK